MSRRVQTQAEHVCSVPYYYIPEKDVVAGPAKMDKEEEHDQGFWLGKLCIGARTADAQGYTKGPLQGFVKVKVSDIGQWSRHPVAHSKVSSARILTLP
jgi:hypothetical protein